ncbi:hypothetical protein [Xanthobacter tagetidis]|jgi:hypothetical protein|uniref:DUF4402 domain-containing protein n=1 Tax=Xanthobacter tagetidis TaxID=60216 RepID=A0A3L7A6X4_9HYPH|nr:hypothetical protein [Xanthobacter tagetidis]MBB6307339.1 hypothetical protein [Xanthobacter tagetidis]RLP75874.1 hypothetical protein D9R14_16445 [Xanthobacter tagetidis]
MSERRVTRSLTRSACAASAAALLAVALAACQGSPDSWGTGVVKETDGFGDYAETVVSVPKPTAGPRQFVCQGPFAPNTTAINIAADFGQANVISAPVMEPDGSVANGTVLLPGDPALRLDIAWGDAIGMTNPRRVAFTEATAWSVNGIGIGASLADVEKANGRPFRIQGFSGPAGGVVADWQGGRLANLGSGCRLGLQLALPATLSDQVQGRVAGPKFFSSSDAAVRAANPTVGLFWVLYR